MGKQPKMLATSKQRVVAVACHPSQDIAAVGYDDGLVFAGANRRWCRNTGATAVGIGGGGIGLERQWRSARHRHR